MEVLGSWTAFAGHCGSPTVVIDSGPSAPTAATGGTFGFHSPEGAGYFECSLDHGAWEACGSPQEYSGLAQGEHSFRVQAAYDWAPEDHGAIAQRTWTVEPTGTGAPPLATFSGQRLTDRSGLGVNVANGNLLVRNADLQIAGTGLDLKVGRFYNSRSSGVGSLGRGWTMGTGEDVRIYDREDRSIRFFGECPRVCVGMSEKESHVFKEQEQGQEWQLR